MLKKLMNSLLALTIVVTSLFAIAGCGNRAKIKFEAYEDDGINYLQIYNATPNESDEEDEESDDPYTGINYRGSYQFKGEKSTIKVEKGSYVLFALQYDDYLYSLNDFKILKDGKKVSGISTSYFQNNPFDGDYLYDLGIIEETTEITFSGHTKKKTYWASPTVLNYDEWANDERTKDIRFQLLVNDKPYTYNSKNVFTGDEIEEVFSSKKVDLETTLAIKVFYKNRDKMLTEDMQLKFASDSEGEPFTRDHISFNPNYETIYSINHFKTAITFDYSAFEDVELEDLTDIDVGLADGTNQWIYGPLFEEGNYQILLTVDNDEIEVDTLTFDNLRKSSSFKMRFKVTDLQRQIILDNDTVVAYNYNMFDYSTAVSKNKITYTEIQDEEGYNYLTIDFGKITTDMNELYIYIARDMIQDPDTDGYTEIGYDSIEGTRVVDIINDFEAINTLSIKEDIQLKFYKNDFSEELAMLYIPGNDVIIYVNDADFESVQGDRQFNLQVTVTYGNNEQKVYLFNAVELSGGADNTLEPSEEYTGITIQDFKYADVPGRYMLTFDSSLEDITSIEFEKITVFKE